MPITCLSRQIFRIYSNDPLRAPIVTKTLKETQSQYPRVGALAEPAQGGHTAVRPPGMPEECPPDILRSCRPCFLPYNLGRVESNNVPALAEQCTHVPDALACAGAMPRRAGYAYGRMPRLNAIPNPF